MTKVLGRRMSDAIERAPKPTPSAALSIDVEDWFHVHNLEAVVARDTWDERELRVERNTERMLELMAERGARCTCFVLGWVAEKCPGLVRRIAAAGHEIASHGYGHELLYTLSPAAFREDVKRGVGLLEAAAGQKVRGYRAPSFSITDWALDVLKELGLDYDSSAFPTAVHDRYGRLSGVEAQPKHRGGPARIVRDLREHAPDRPSRGAMGGRRLLPPPTLLAVRTWHQAHSE